MRRLVPVCAAVAAVSLSVAGCSANPSNTPSRDVKAAQMTVEYTWVRTTAESKMPDMTGAFMSLSNPADHEIRLTGCSSQVAGMCQIHEMVKGADGKMVMQEAKGGVAVPAGGHLHLKPGSYHVMLMNLKKQLPVGDEVTITLTFSEGDEQTVTAPVKKFTEEGDHYHATPGASMSPSATPTETTGG